MHDNQRRRLTPEICNNKKPADRQDATGGVLGVESDYLQPVRRLPSRQLDGQHPNARHGQLPEDAKEKTRRPVRRRRRTGGRFNWSQATRIANAPTRRRLSYPAGTANARKMLRQEVSQQRLQRRKKPPRLFGTPERLRISRACFKPAIPKRVSKPTALNRGGN